MKMSIVLTVSLFATLLLFGCSSLQGTKGVSLQVLPLDAEQFDRLPSPTINRVVGSGAMTRSEFGFNSSDRAYAPVVAVLIVRNEGRNAVAVPHLGMWWETVVRSGVSNQIKRIPFAGSTYRGGPVFPETTRIVQPGEAFCHLLEIGTSSFFNLDESDEIWVSCTHPAIQLSSNRIHPLGPIFNVGPSPTNTVTNEGY